MRDLSIYIHIPFCVRKCLYCDFLSFAMPAWQEETMASGREWPEERLSCTGIGAAGYGQEKEIGNVISYGNLLKREITAQAEKYRDHQVISIFWGGGTPSLLGTGMVQELMGVIHRYYAVIPEAEVTMEANPGTVTAQKLRGYITAGINRLSIGLQSTFDQELERIGRIHDYRTFLETYRLAREAGFHNINIDLMAALPGQSVASYAETLHRVAELTPEHISAYSLILEEGTPLYERQEEYQFPDEEEEREMYLLTEQSLASCGYRRYEISNYARKGYECRHNKVYWQRGDYVGFGLGAASMVRNVRWSNPPQFGEYEMYVIRQEQKEKTVLCQKAETEGGEALPVQILTRQEQMEEFMFLGLRMMCGVSREMFYKLYGQRIEKVYGTILDKLYAQKLLVCEKDAIRLTPKGIDVSNYVMAQFLF